MLCTVEEKITGVFCRCFALQPCSGLSLPDLFFRAHLSFQRAFIFKRFFNFFDFPCINSINIGKLYE